MAWNFKSNVLIKQHCLISASTPVPVCFSLENSSFGTSKGSSQLQRAQLCPWVPSSRRRVLAVPVPHCHPPSRASCCLASPEAFPLSLCPQLVLPLSSHVPRLSPGTSPASTPQLQQPEIHTSTPLKTSITPHHYTGSLPTTADIPFFLFLNQSLLYIFLLLHNLSRPITILLFIYPLSTQNIHPV